MNERLVLIALYDLADGRTDRVVSRAEITKHIDSLGLWSADAATIEAYRKRTVARVQAARKAAAS